jgi:hypothetical protein
MIEGKKQGNRKRKRARARQREKSDFSGLVSVFISEQDTSPIRDSMETGSVLSGLEN